MPSQPEYIILQASRFQEKKLSELNMPSFFFQMYKIDWLLLPRGGVGELVERGQEYYHKGIPPLGIMKIAEEIYPKIYRVHC